MIHNAEKTAIDFSALKYGKLIKNEFTIINKQKKEVAFIPNQAQDDVLQQMERFRSLILLKARKMGFSSVILAVWVAKFLFGENERLVSVSFDKDAGEKQLQRAKHFLRSFELKRGIKVDFGYNSKKEMTREGISKKTGRPFTNTLRVGSALSYSFGRGDDITGLHITEAAFSRDIFSLLASVGEACIDVAPKILETTANGFNSFKDLWDMSLEGKTEFKALFYGPEWEYSEDYIERKRESLGRIGMQEYPRTAEESFLTTGECYFDAVVIGTMLEAMKGRDPIAFQFLE